MPKELKKLTFQLIDRASPYKVMKNERDALREQKALDISFVGAMANATAFAESSVEFPRQLGSYSDISDQKVLLTQIPDKLNAFTVMPTFEIGIS